MIAKKGYKCNKGVKLANIGKNGPRELDIAEDIQDMNKEKQVTGVVNGVYLPPIFRRIGLKELLKQQKGQKMKRYEIIEVPLTNGDKMRASGLEGYKLIAVDEWSYYMQRELQEDEIVIHVDVMDTEFGNSIIFESDV
jgi:hypothetical protein